jgi:hypothetical protein
LAHFKESLDYYERLEVAEIEGDLLKAVVSKNAAKVATLRKTCKSKNRVKSNRIKDTLTAKLV